MTALAAFAPPAAIRSPKVHALYSYWERLRNQRIAPPWTEIDPGEIRSILSYVIVTDFLAEPFDVRFRIVGTSIVEAYGEDFMGRKLADLEATGGHELWYEIYARVIAEARPHYGRYHLPSDDERSLDADSAIFPLSGNGRQVNRTIEVEDWSAALRQSPGILMRHDWRYETL
jgi:hypothetical protein